MLMGPCMEELLDKIEETAHNYTIEFGGSARCVLKAIQDHLEIGNGVGLKGLTPLSCGVAIRGDTCGALLGGLFAIGLVVASEDLRDLDAANNSMIAGLELVREVEREFGTTNCVKIQTERFERCFDLSDPEQHKAFIREGGPRHCAKVVAKIARMSAEFLLYYEKL